MLAAESNGQRATRIAVVVVVAAALGSALTSYPASFRELNNRAAHNAQLTETDRMLEITEPLGLSREFVLAAIRTLPEDARYAVETGENADATPLARSALPGYLENLLLPRVQTRNEPDWVLCYGCEPAQLPGRIVWSEGGAAIARNAA